MIGARLGRYRVEAELGSGGMGTVYRATVVEPHLGLLAGDRVALKVVHPHLIAREGFFKRFLREAELGKRVRHENVVRTFDIDATEVDGKTVLFLVTEYVEGRTLRRTLHDLGAVPEGLLREIGSQVAGGLAAVHEAGIVHRDLKPENVLVTDDHRVRIMDLGVARLVEVSVVLTQEGLFTGSLLYASPEQLGRRPVGPPSDLYALGVMLYELASGTNPFHGDDTAAVIRAHLEETPTSLRERDPDLSPFFSEMVATLLQKRPEGRFPSASVVRDLLQSGEASTWWAEREQNLLASASWVPSLPVRRETSLRGRDDELQLLNDAWRRARGRDGNTVLLEGEAGIGKTRLLDAFLRQLDAATDTHVFYGAYLPSGGMGGISEAILAHFGRGQLQEAVRPYLEETPSLVPAFAAVVKHEGLPEGVETLPSEALQSVMVHLMRALAQEKPLLWVVDDLHFAQPESRMVLIALARAVTDQRILLVVTARPGLPEDEIAHLSRLHNFQRRTLSRLSPREVIEMLRDAFRSSVLAEKLGGKIAYKSDGVPYFVFEMIRGLKDGGFLEQGSQGTWIETRAVEDIEVPSAVKDLVDARLKDLSLEERAILDVGAVVGFEFDPTLVADVLGRNRIPVLQVLAEVERRSGLVRATGRNHRFDHHQVQEVLYRVQPESLRVEYHTALAEVMATRVKASASAVDEIPQETVVFLAKHHLEGVRPAEGLSFLPRALDHLEASYQNEDLIRLLDRALLADGLLDEETRVTMLLRKAKQLGARGRPAAEREVIDEAVHLVETLDLRSLHAQALTDLGWHLVRTAEFEEASDVLLRAIELARDAGDPGLQASAMQNLGVALSHQARYAESRARFEEAVRLARDVGNVRMESVAQGSLGTVYRALGDFDRALELHQRHLDLARRVGDQRGVMNALGNYANVLTYQGKHDEARRYYEDALSMAREVGDRYAEGSLLGNIGGAYHVQGRNGRALEYYERALAMSREIGNRQGEANVLLNRGTLFHLLGEMEEAKRLLDETLVITRETGVRRIEGHALLSLSEVAEVAGLPAEARRSAEEALEIFEAIGNRVGGCRARVQMARILEREGDLQEAASRLRDVLEEVEAIPAPGLAAQVRCLLASLSGGDVAAAAEAVEDHGDAMSRTARIEGRFRLWRTTGDRHHLEAAHEDLMQLRDEAPEAYRDSCLTKVPLNRDVREAWRQEAAADDAGGA